MLNNDNVLDLLSEIKNLPIKKYYLNKSVRYYNINQLDFQIH